MVSTRQSSNSTSTTSINDAGFSEKSYESTQRKNHSPPVIAGPSANQQINLLDMPVEILQKILGYLDYNSIAHLRPVCHQFDRVCGSILNSTFQRLQTQMHSRFQSIKSQMPRRESARRNHPLACESDIIETLHMRLTLLQMSFGKHIERKHCCFFPGEILDEVFRILHYIKITPKLARPYKVTDELFDLSTMAMEYFKDCIEPTLPEIPYFGADFLDIGVPFSSSSSVNKFSLCLESSSLSVSDGKTRNSVGGSESSPLRLSHEEQASFDASVAGHASPPQSNMVLRKRIRKIKQGMKRYNNQLSLMRRDLRSCKSKIAEQQKQLVEYATRLDDNDKKNEETSRKFSTLLQELNKCKTELQYWRSKSPAIPVCFGCGQAMPVPDLANQSFVPGMDIPPGEGLEFIPINDFGIRSPTEREGSSALIQQHPQNSHMHQQQNSHSCCSCNTNSAMEAMAPPKAPPPFASLASTSTKRKCSSSTHEGLQSVVDIKKPRRALKSRQAKRTKF